MKINPIFTQKKPKSVKLLTSFNFCVYATVMKEAQWQYLTLTYLFLNSQQCSRSALPQQYLKLLGSNGRGHLNVPSTVPLELASQFLQILPEASTILEIIDSHTRFYSRVKTTTNSLQIIYFDTCFIANFPQKLKTRLITEPLTCVVCSALNSGARNSMIIVHIIVV